MDFLKKAQKKMKEMMEEKDAAHGTTSTDPSHHGAVGDQSHHQQPPQGSYSAPPPQGQAGLPPLPPGWIAQWDQNSQRYFYVEQATGRTQWEAPVAAYGAPSGYAPPSGYGAPPSGYGAPPHGAYGSHDQHGHDTQGHSSSGKGTAIAAGVGGLAVGAIGGAIIAHELTEDDNHAAAAAPAAGYGAAPAAGYGAPPADPSYGAAPAADPYAATMPPEVPEETADGESISSSDQEELEERREELEEAQEEYNEAVEEAYDD
ncbi:hypothetical protein DV738_g4365, partial [Chaetothyriales sp. CBS 135597]